MVDEIKNNIGILNPTDESKTFNEIGSALESKFTDSEIENLKRWGFQHAIKERRAENLSPDALLQQYKRKLDDELERWKSIYDNIQKRFDHKIEALKKEIKEVEGSRPIEDFTLTDLKKRKDDILTEMKEHRNNIIAVRNKLATAKEDMMNKCLDEAENQIHRAIGLQKKVYNETREINQMRYNDSKATFHTQINNWEQKRSQFLDRQKDLQKHMKRIGIDGVTPYAANTLMGIGASVAAAAGYFFSVFASKASFGTQDPFSSILISLLKAIASEKSNLLTKTGILLLVVLGIGLISWLCHYLIDKMFSSKPGQKKEEFWAWFRGKKNTENTKSSVGLKVRSWLSLWLHIMPIVILLGLLLILLANDSSITSQVSTFDFSIEGLVAGTAIALGMGGMICLYLMKIVEPRLLKKHEQEDGLINWVKYNWELASSILIFVLFTLTIIYCSWNAKPGDANSPITIAILEYTAVCLISAFPFAYGLRFRGLISINHYLQREIDQLDIWIANYSTPDIPDTNIDSTYRMNNIVEGIMSVIQTKALILHGAGSTEDLTDPRNPQDKNIFLTMLRKMTKEFRKASILGRSRVSNIDILTELADWERRYFPELDEQLNILSFQYKECERELKKTEEQIGKIDTNFNAEKERKKELIKRIDLDIEIIHQKIEKLEDNRIKRLSKIESFYANAEAAILDGFHLGVWYCQNQIGPESQYYINKYVN